jgi:LytS/YehU family sensor histidine kinase
MLIGVLAALGYMHGIDAQQRTLVLRNVQFERTRMARDAYESRLKSLQARVEPRFLFDTLADVEALYESNPARAQRMLDDLIVYLRAALPGLNEDASSLSAELTLARMWLDIMRVRDGDGLSYSVDEPAPAHDVRMPPMLVLPLVQQAFASGIGGSSERPDVAVVAEVADGRVRVVVTAAGPAFATGVTAEANALVRERLRTLYEANATLEFRPVGDDMSEATLEIPHEPANRRHR